MRMLMRDLGLTKLFENKLMWFIIVFSILLVGCASMRMNLETPTFPKCILEVEELVIMVEDRNDPPMSSESPGDLNLVFITVEDGGGPASLPLPAVHPIIADEIMRECYGHDL